MSLKKNEIIEQVEFCVNLTNRLKEAVVVHEGHRASKKEWNSHSYVAEWGSGIVEKGASKTQIMSERLTIFALNPPQSRRNSAMVCVRLSGNTVLTTPHLTRL